MIAFLGLVGQERALDDSMSRRQILVEFFEGRCDGFAGNLQRGAERSLSYVFDSGDIPVVYFGDQRFVVRLLVFQRLIVGNEFPTGDLAGVPDGIGDNTIKDAVVLQGDFDLFVEMIPINVVGIDFSAWNQRITTECQDLIHLIHPQGGLTLFEVADKSKAYPGSFGQLVLGEP
jgi:hypothetical protein